MHASVDDICPYTPATRAAFSAEKAGNKTTKFVSRSRPELDTAQANARYQLAYTSTWCPGTPGAMYWLHVRCG